jgi:hypothetical protein
MTITLLQFVAMQDLKSKFNWFRVPLIHKVHQEEFQLIISKDDLPAEEQVSPDKILPMLGFIPTYTDESAEVD